MTKLEKLKSEILFATKSRNELASSLLKIVLGECQNKDKYDDDFIISYCRKIIQSNSETMRLGGDSVKLSRENELLKEYVPKELSVEELQVHADKLAIEIVDAKSDGQAKGILSKYLKSIGTSADGVTLEIVINKLRKAVTV
jgi:uncharacterized protein YqeY